MVDSLVQKWTPYPKENEFDIMLLTREIVLGLEKIAIPDKNFRKSFIDMARESATAEAPKIIFAPDSKMDPVKHVSTKLTEAATRFDAHFAGESRVDKAEEFLASKIAELAILFVPQKTQAIPGCEETGFVARFETREIPVSELVRSHLSREIGKSSLSYAQQQILDGLVSVVASKECNR